ncbi:hypothetical protein [Bacillus cihuensis]|uniref:hypothetical protein n=1 Tax=Bacillus cihuensis TaxID=1208599 RepID=UPI0006872669|nr:hypothetical protein [Bacillus cihuensis]
MTKFSKITEGKVINIKKVICIFGILFLLALVGCSSKNNAGQDKPKESINNQHKVEETTKESGKDIVREERDWKESEYFKIDNNTLIGTPNLLGVTFDENDKFYVNKPQKHIWYFWGTGEQLNGKLTVKAIHQDTSEQIELVKDAPMGGSLNGANGHAPTTMKFNKSGTWALDTYIGDKLFGSVTIMVED